jgi:hypothetical protein
MGARQLGITLGDDHVDKITAFLDSPTGEGYLSNFSAERRWARLARSRNLPSDGSAEQPVAHALHRAGGGQCDDHESEQGGGNPHRNNNAVAFHKPEQAGRGKPRSTRADKPLEALYGGLHARDQRHVVGAPY